MLPVTLQSDEEIADTHCSLSSVSVSGLQNAKVSRCVAISITLFGVVCQTNIAE